MKLMDMSMKVGPNSGPVVDLDSSSDREHIDGVTPGTEQLQASLPHVITIPSSIILLNSGFSIVEL